MEILEKIRYVNKKWLIMFGVGIVLIVLLTTVLLYQSTPQKEKTFSPETSPTPLVNQTQPNTEKLRYNERGSFLPQEEIDYAWGAVPFAESDLDGTDTTKEVLNDGTTRYLFESPNLKRPDMIIVDKGIIVFTRQVLQDTKSDNYIFSNGKPVRIIRDPGYYGPDAVTYIYPGHGLAFTTDPKTNLVYEQFIFKPTTLEDFNLKYKEYLQ